MTDQRYLRPAGFEIYFNRAVGQLAKLGISLMGTRMLAVKGRTSGQWRTTPVNLLTVGDARYLVAPRGEAQWVRNIRAAGGGELRLGRATEKFTVTELADADKPPIIRAYLARWGWQVGKFFDGITKDTGDKEIIAAGPGFPVFRID